MCGEKKHYSNASFEQIDDTNQNKKLCIAIQNERKNCLVMTEAQLSLQSVGNRRRVKVPAVTRRFRTTAQSYTTGNTNTHGDK